MITNRWNGGGFYFRQSVIPVYTREAGDELSEFVDDDYPDGVTDADFDRGLELCHERDLHQVDDVGDVIIDWDSVRRGIRGETYSKYVTRITAEWSC